jgi:serine protease AprX
MERLVRADPGYRRRASRKRRRDRSLGGALEQQRLGRVRIWTPVPGTEFSLRLNHRRIEELASVARLIEVRTSIARQPVQRATAIPARPVLSRRQEQRMRYKLRFPSPADMNAALAAESPSLNIKLRIPRRGLLAVEMPESLAKSQAAQADFAAALKWMERSYKAQVVEDILYAPEVIQFSPESAAPTHTLEDVLKEIKAPDVWPRTRGEQVVIAIVDSGINGNRAEFPVARRAGQFSPSNLDPWEDDNGHGTMCACIATASAGPGSEFTGVAPAASLYSCRTNFYSTDLVTIFDHLRAEAGRGLKIVASNSWGHPSTTEPEDDPELLSAVQDAIGAGVIVVCSAGNYHALAGGLPGGNQPTTIWLHKCRDEVLTVAAHRLDNSQMWDYSSRGPGHYKGHQVGQRSKPDVTSPSPPEGRILYGDRARILTNGWGTSGSCPQVAGLAALLWSLDPSLSSAAISDIIRSTAKSLGHHPYCQGAGKIDCAAATATIP